MNYKAVITGDIVASSRSIDFRGNLLDVIKETCEGFKESDLSYEIFRGDSFQIVLESPEFAAKLALIMRCALKSSTPEKCSQKWDARLSIGIGGVEYYSESPATSDGEAFRLSGRGLDTIKKKRMSVHSPWEEFNEAIYVSTAFLDDLVTSWSVSQSAMMLEYIKTNLNNKKLAEMLGTSQQNLSKKLKTAQAENVTIYMKFFENTVKKHTDKEFINPQFKDVIFVKKKLHKMAIDYVSA